MHWISLIVIALAAEPAVGEYYWPNPKEMRQFVVMDGITGLRDIAQDQRPVTISSFAELDTSRLGPFSQPQSSYGVSEKSVLCYLRSIAANTSVTYAIYFYTPANASDGAILSDYHNLPVIHIGYKGRSLQINSTFWNKTVNSEAVYENFFTPNQWTFAAVTYDYARAVLKLYNDKGILLKTWQNFVVADRTRSYVYLGYTWGDTKSGTRFYHFMHPSDSMACFFLYNTALTPTEISELPGVCQRKGSLPET